MAKDGQARLDWGEAADDAEHSVLSCEPDSREVRIEWRIRGTTASREFGRPNDCKWGTVENHESFVWKVISAKVLGLRMVVN